MYNRTIKPSTYLKQKYQLSGKCDFFPAGRLPYICTRTCVCRCTANLKCIRASAWIDEFIIEEKRF